MLLGKKSNNTERVTVKSKSSLTQTPGLLVSLPRGLYSPMELESDMEIDVMLLLIMFC